MWLHLLYVHSCDSPNTFYNMQSSFYKSVPVAKRSTSIQNNRSVHGMKEVIRHFLELFCTYCNMKFYQDVTRMSHDIDCSTGPQLVLPIAVRRGCITLIASCFRNWLKAIVVSESKNRFLMYVRTYALHILIPSWIKEIPNTIITRQLTLHVSNWQNVGFRPRA